MVIFHKYHYGFLKKSLQISLGIPSLIPLKAILKEFSETPSGILPEPPTILSGILLRNPSGFFHEHFMDSFENCPKDVLRYHSEYFI